MTGIILNTKKQDIVHCLPPSHPHAETNLLSLEKNFTIYYPSIVLM